MDLGISGKTAFVAASTGGLGLAIARALAAEGVRVAITGRREVRAKEIVAELTDAYGPGAVAIEADLSTAEGVAAAVEQTVAELGPIDILVLNGPGPKPGAAATLGADDIAAAFEQLVKPHHALVSHILPGMRERRWGRILAVGSSGVVAPLPNLAVSNTGRAALAGYLKTLAAEVAWTPSPSTCSSPAGSPRTGWPNWTRPPPTARHHPRGNPARIPQDHPARRYGEPEEFGAAAAFLCSAPASYITGVALRCDGGLIRGL